MVASYDAGSTPAEFSAYVSSALTPLAMHSESKQTTAETMLEAHETLTALSPENAPRFKDVLEFLREDLKRKAGNSGPAS